MLKKKTNKHKHAKKPPTDLLVKIFPARVLTRPLSLITHIVAHKRVGTPHQNMPSSFSIASLYCHFFLSVFS